MEAIFIGDLTIFGKNSDNEVEIEVSTSDTYLSEFINAEQADLIINNLSEQFGLKYAGVSEIYKILDDKISGCNYHELGNKFREALQEIEERYPQVKEL